MVSMANYRSPAMPLEACGCAYVTVRKPMVQSRSNGIIMGTHRQLLRSELPIIAVHYR